MFSVGAPNRFFSSYGTQGVAYMAPRTSKSPAETVEKVSEVVKAAAASGCWRDVDQRGKKGGPPS